MDNRSYSTLKQHYDNVLNKDKSTYKTSNDEPTPIGCVEEIISKVPREFWLKENLKILDPCCGNGNFHLVIREKFNEARNTTFTLYFNDINTDRLNNAMKIFGGNNSRINVNTINFLENTEEQLYDMVVANPPYAKFDAEGNRSSKNHNLVKLFIDKALSVVKDKGFIVFIVPNNWMSYADRNKLIMELTALQFHWLDIGSAKKWFPKIGSSFSWFVLQKTPAFKDFTVCSLYRKVFYQTLVKSQTRLYIPLLYSNLVQQILGKTVDTNIQKFAVETSSDLHKFTKKLLIRTEETQVFKYRLKHTPKQTVWASRQHKYQLGYKVFISITDTYSVCIDKDCGMTQSIAFIRCITEEEAKKISKTLQHPLYVFLNNICRWGNFNNVRILQHFPVPENDQDIYDSFGITDVEKAFILKGIFKK